MGRISEYEVENLFIDRLESIGYEYIESKNYDDMFSSDCLYSIIANTLFYEDKTLYDKINEYSGSFESTFSMSLKVTSTNENLHFVKLTSLGENFGKCCFGQNN